MQVKEILLEFKNGVRRAKANSEKNKNSNTS